MNIQNLFSDKKVNTGRQVELDIAKGLAIVFMIFVHVIIILEYFNTDLSSTYLFVFDNVLGRPYAAVIFMFCMGVGIVYSRHSQWNTMIKRGVKLYLLGILVNFFEFVLPYYLVLFLALVSLPFEGYAEALLFVVDILAFAGITFVLMGILKKFNFSNKKLIIVAVVLSLIGTFLRFTDFGDPAVNLVAGNLIGTDFTAFPLFNWFIIPIAGYIWGQYFIRVKDKREFFKFWPILLIVSALYFFISSKLWGGVFSDDIVFYYYLNTLDAIFCIINAHAVIGLCYWLIKFLPDSIIKIFTILSTNINNIYIAQWFFIPITIIVIIYFVKDIVFNDFLAAVLSIIMLIVSTLVALGYKKLRTQIKNRKC